jgi:hypothetical protein
LKNNINIFKEIWIIFYKSFIQTHRFWRMSPCPKFYYLTILVPIKFFWEIFSLKRSHWFTWLKGGDSPVCMKDIKNNQLISVSESPIFLPHDTWFITFIGLNWIWRTTTILQPVSYLGDYQIGFIRSDGVIVFCSVVIPGGPIAVIQGPIANNFFAFSYSKGIREPIELMIVKENINKWSLNKVALL